MRAAWMKNLNNLLFYLRNKKNFTLLKSSNNTLRHNSADMHRNVPIHQTNTLSRHLLAISEQEKANLARELHDELGSNLMVMRINLATALEKFGQNNPELANHLQETLQLLKNTVDIKCHIIENLRPSMLEDFGLAATIHSYCDEIACRSGIEINVNIEGDFAQIDSARSIALYRIVQESLTNIVKHAHATRVTISLNRFEDKVQLSISDNGVGITTEVLKKPKSHGILGMRERATLNGGSFEIAPCTNGHGTCINAVIPFTDV
jgi:signal transduction histidine kinase